MKRGRVVVPKAKRGRVALGTGRDGRASPQIRPFGRPTPSRSGAAVRRGPPLRRHDPTVRCARTQCPPWWHLDHSDNVHLVHLVLKMDARRQRTRFPGAENASDLPTSPRQHRRRCLSQRHRARGAVGREQPHHLRCRAALRDARPWFVPHRRGTTLRRCRRHCVGCRAGASGERDHGSSHRSCCRGTAGDPRVVGMRRAAAAICGWREPPAVCASLPRDRAT